MAAYGGYVAAQPADLSGLISDFGTKAIAIKEAQKERAEKQELLKQQKAEKIAERDERRAYEEKQAEIKDIGKETDEALKRINKETTLSPSITLNEVYGKSTNYGSNIVHNLTKAMKEDPQNRGVYSGKIQNVVQQMEEIAKAKEDLTKGTEDLTKDVPNQSKQGKFLGSIYMSMGDLNGFDVKESESGDKIQYFKKDADGNEIPGTTFEPSVFKNYYKYKDPKEDFNKSISDFLGTIETRDVTQKSGPRTQTKITSIENNPAYEPSKEAWKKGFLADDARVARYLTDSGRYGMYYNELQNVPGSDGNKFIVYEMKDNGGVFPKLTPEQKEEASAMLDDQFKAMLKESKSESRDQDITVNTGTKDKEPRESQQERQATLKSAEDSFNAVFLGKDRKSQQKVYNRIKGIYSKGNPEETVVEPKYNKNGNIYEIKIWSRDSDGEKTEMGSIKTAEDFFGIYTPKDKNGSEFVNYDRAIKEREPRFNNQ